MGLIPPFKVVSGGNPAALLIGSSKRCTVAERVLTCNYLYLLANIFVNYAGPCGIVTVSYFDACIVQKCIYLRELMQRKVRGPNLPPKTDPVSMFPPARPHRDSWLRI
jgi:hypothetical protein